MSTVGPTILRRTRSLGAAAIALFIAGCSGEPGEADVRAALERNEKTILGLSMLFFDPGNRNADPADTAKRFLREAAIKIDGCAQAQGAPGFMCDFRMGRPDGKAMSPPLKGRFFKTDDGWHFEETK